VLVQFSAKAAFIESLVPDAGKTKQSGPTIITSDSMDIDMKNNIVTLIGSVVVEDKNNKISANKIDLFLEDSEQKQDAEQGTKQNDKDKKIKLTKTSGKEARNIVATGNVVILNKPNTSEEKIKGDRKAMSGKAEYNLKTGVIVLTEKPVIYQGDNYIRGKVITLWRDSDRMKVEGDQSIGQISKLVIGAEGGFNPSSTTDTHVTTAEEPKEQLGNTVFGK